MDTDPRYTKLSKVLLEAYNHAAKGKGKERHGTDDPFEEQHMVRGGTVFGIGGPLFQAHKKIEEAMRLPPERRKAELLGAIVYTAGAIIAEEITLKRGGGSSNS